MSVAKSYAQALFELSKERHASVPDAAQVEKELGAVAAAFAASTVAAQLLGGAALTSAERSKVVGAVCEKIGVSAGVTRAMRIGAEKGRAPLFGAIHEEFIRLRVESEGGLLGDMASAEVLDARDQEELASAFSRKLGKKVHFKTRVDSGLIAGVKVTVDGVTYDGTVRAQLQRAKAHLFEGISGNA
jgi:F-type H+-transporting ATPase subunit delta